MSGLETAIRNALDRSDRADRDVRARIYQSARQALDAGLRKQGVSDRLVVMQQHELLERRIHEIEMEEARRVEDGPLDVLPDDPLANDPLADSPPIGPDPQPRHAASPVDLRSAAPEPVAVAPAGFEAPGPHAAWQPEITLGGETRSPAYGASAAPDIGMASVARPGAVQPMQRGEVIADLDEIRARSAPAPQERSEPAARSRAKKEKAAKPDRRSRRTAALDTGLDVPPERAAKPRRRRGFLSHLLTWLITLGIVGGACWWFYQSGMVQSFIDEVLKAEQADGQRSGNFDPRRGFSDEWVEIFTPSKLAQMKPGPQARVEPVAASEGQAVRILSATADSGGDVAIDVPPEVLREMAGKSSTVALTLQSGSNNTVQLSVRCDFGSLGSCSRHRFTATQERQEALFHVSFDRSLAPNRPGRLILNGSIDGANRPVLLYSVRILPGQ